MSEEQQIRITVWNENVHEKEDPAVAAIYPRGIHGTIADALIAMGGFSVRTATLDQPEHGLSDDVLNTTDVLIWWGHMAHHKVRDAIVDKVQQRVLAGMGLIVLHSGHFSKIFRRLMGTNCSLKWREMAEKERLWNIAPAHPITQGIGEYFELPHTEMYGERFDIPEPDQLIFISWFAGGEVFRSGCVFNRGNGRVFYFRPGHETYPIYHDANVMRVIGNAARWLKPVVIQPTDPCPNVPKPMEKL
jgi:trehalose utilization protein